MRSGFLWFHLGTGGGVCEHGTAALGSIDSSVTVDQPVDYCLPK